MSYMYATQIQHNHGLAPSGFCCLHKYIWILSLDQCWFVCSPFPYLPCLKKIAVLFLRRSHPHDSSSDITSSPISGMQCFDVTFSAQLGLLGNPAKSALPPNRKP